MKTILNRRGVTEQGVAELETLVPAFIAIPLGKRGSYSLTI